MIKGNIKSDRVLKKGKISQPWTISDSSLFPLNITTVFFFTMIAVRQLFSLWEKKNHEEVKVLKKKKIRKKKNEGGYFKVKVSLPAALWKVLNRKSGGLFSIRHGTDGRK